MINIFSIIFMFNIIYYAMVDAEETASAVIERQ